MMLYLILGAAFLGVACLVGGVATILFRSEGSLEVESRLDVLTGAASPTGKDKKAEAALLSSPLNDVPNVLEEYVKQWFNLRVILQQADVPLTPSKFVAISAALGVAGVLLLPLAQVPIYFAPLGFILAGLPLAARRCYIPSV